MDGLNTIYREYGSNEKNLFVLQITNSWISINYWSETNGVEYASAESEKGGSALNAAFGTNPFDGTMLLIAPDKSFKGALPERYGKQEGVATFEEIFEAANIEKSGDTPIQSSHKLLQTKKETPHFDVTKDGQNMKLIMHQKGLATINLYSCNGRMHLHSHQEWVCVNSEVAIPWHSEAATGMYILEVTINGLSQSRTLYRK